MFGIIIGIRGTKKEPLPTTLCKPRETMLPFALTW